MGVAVVEKRIFEEWLQRRDKVTYRYDRYRAQRVVVNGQFKSQKESCAGDGESDWGMISRVTKDVLKRGKASEER